MANIAERFARRGEKEFANFLSMAHGSAAEVESHLYVALDLRYIGEEEFAQLWKTAEEASAMVEAFRSYLLEYRRRKQGREGKVRESWKAFPEEAVNISEVGDEG